MPVSFSVAPHNANSIELTQSFSAEEILSVSCNDQYRYVDEILQCAFSGHEQGSGRNFEAKIPNLLPDGRGNGFVNTVMNAYNDHRALVIRPDDVWLTILSQLNFFVNANAEVLRANFVATEGKRELVVVVAGNRYNVDFGDMSRQMVGLIEKNVVDPTLRKWVLPDFTTTTVNDTTVASVLMMASLKQYFSYGFGMSFCGIPRVTLEGEKADWINILERLEKLKEYGIKTIAWYHLLRPVISRFVAAFDDPTSQENANFWQQVAYLHQPGSGAPSYTGWINAFNAFSQEGRWIGTALNMEATSEEAPETLPADHFWSKYAKYGVDEDFVFDGSPFHTVMSYDMPPAYAQVDVKLDDNGVEIDSFMLAGMIGMQVSSSGDVGLSSSGENDTVRPLAGWWICVKKQNVMSVQEEEEARIAKWNKEREEKRKEWAEKSVVI
ncbi:hypothetical protein FB45DRAFT_389662 [Roridomyces roridus]|uniref:Uncharacterized protein n=1 Tax=Roridomyces roridus TaxID=1738132 RepID=A0AAD7B359_9AGAR|nr:hypothetical protein FB45DRAFT_389662 [Roridomyces roridus]